MLMWSVKTLSSGVKMLHHWHGLASHVNAHCMQFPIPHINKAELVTPAKVTALHQLNMIKSAYDWLPEAKYSDQSANTLFPHDRERKKAVNCVPSR